MTLNLLVPQQSHTDFTPRITVIGVGGGGTNAVDNMIAMNLQGVEFVVANTDAQQLVHSRASRRVQLGPHITQGLGAGAKPEVGKMAAEEAAEELDRHLDGAHMVFITAGMGGGTGTGAAPVIAKMAKERGILTVGVVTKPFTFEGTRRARAAEAGIEELQGFVDTLIVIPNQNLFRLANDRTGWKEAFKMADNVLYMGVRGVTDLMMAPGLINLDFADIRTVMAEMGKAMMGTGEADGEGRAVRAAEAAINNPLLEDTSMAGARGLLINITGGEDMTLFEVDEAANRIRQEVDEEANIIFGSIIDESLAGKIRVSMVATGIDAQQGKGTERIRLVAGGGAPVPAVAVQQAPSPTEAVVRPLPAVAAVAGGMAVPGLRPAVSPAINHGLPQRAAQPAVRPVSQTTGQLHGLNTTSRTQGATALATPPAEIEPALAGYDPVPMQSDQSRATTANPSARQTQVPQPQARQVRIPGDQRDNGLFAQPPAAPVQPVTGKSLFRRVTDTIRGTSHESAPPAASATARVDQGFAEPRQGGARLVDRQTALEDTQFDIPTFLRKQTNPN